MAQHDFINKKRPNKKAPPPKAKLPIGLSLLAIVLVSGLSYGLWYITHNKPPAQVAEQTKAPIKVQKKPEIKPQPPKFIEEIKSHEIEVEVTEQEQKGPYALICGSFKTSERAETQKAMIAFQGISSEISQSKNGYYRVKLGPYNTKRLAESDRNKLKRANAARCQILNWS